MYIQYHIRNNFELLSHKNNIKLYAAEDQVVAHKWGSRSVNDKYYLNKVSSQTIIIIHITDTWQQKRLSIDLKFTYLIK